MTRAIITGVTGQDGSYLAELLLHKGYRVVGATRNTQTAEKQLPDTLTGNIELVEWNMSDQAKMVEVLGHYQPNELYNFAAFSSGTGMFDDAPGIGDVNGLAVARMLEAIREVDPRIRFCQASSSEMFGEAVESTQNEATVFRPRSPYGAAKLYAHSMVNIYRQNYGLFACSAILFNHESPMRGLAYVTRKVSHQAARIKLGMATELSLGNLEARRDWGYAGDYVIAMHDMLQAPQADDFVISSGKSHSVRELCEIAFSHLGLDYRDHVREDPGAYRASETFQLVGDSARARAKLGWTPRVGFRDLIINMVDADLRLLTKANDINN